MTEPRVSLVISTYKRAALLEEALQSVAGSQIPESASIEVIVVDNNSRDDTADTVGRIIEGGFPFPLRYELETEQGISAARNCGTRAASGEFVVFMDDDQRIEERYLSRVCDQFAETQADCLCGPIHYYNAENLPSWLPPLLENTGQFYAGDKSKVIKGSEIELHGGNMAFERNALVASGGFDCRLGRRGEELLAGEEPELQARLQRAGKKIVYTPQLVQYHYLRPDRLTKRYWRRHQFDYGRTVYRQSKMDTQKNTRTLAGVPRWLWLFLVTRDIPRLATSVLDGDEQTRLERQLAICFRVGQIKEARRAAFDKETGSDS